MVNGLAYKTADLNRKEDFSELQIGDRVKYITPYEEEGPQTGVVAVKNPESLCIVRRDVDSFGREGVLEHVFVLEGDKIIDYGRANNAFVPRDSPWKHENEKYQSIDVFLKGAGL
jgi:hypothetical protein